MCTKVSVKSAILRAPGSSSPRCFLALLSPSGASLAFLFNAADIIITLAENERVISRFEGADRSKSVELSSLPSCHEKNACPQCHQAPLAHRELNAWKYGKGSIKCCEKALGGGWVRRITSKRKHTIFARRCPDRQFLPCPRPPSEHIRYRPLFQIIS